MTGRQSTDDPDFFRKKYEELLKEYEEFSYIVSHDLNSPMRHIKHFTQILFSEIETGLNEQQKLYGSLIQGAAEEGRKALEGLLEFSQLSTGEKNFETLDMNDLIAGILAVMAPEIEKAEATVVVQTLPPVSGDADLIGRLFSYLIDNAIKFRPKERGNAVEIGATADEGGATFHIKDNGIGMAQDKIPEALTIFRKLNADEDYQGLGVGLTFARKIADIHNGSLRVESEKDKGTTVYISLAS